ncbi:MAG: hypothetical protein K8T10_08435 [Candidatus Eremiobacteraeota bacterium]|nr:hypothetical protein [Candidatus Eremiobacteraeota bacterium]
MPQKTEEAPKFLLLEAIMDLIDEKIDQEKLREKLKDSREGLEQIKNDFETDYNDLDEKVKEGVEKEVQVVYKLFGDWENAFQAVEEFFKTGQKFDLIRAGEMVKRCSEVLNVAFDDYRNKALLVMGPTNIPNLNLLIQSCNEADAGDPLDKLKVVIAREYYIAEGAIRELEFERKHVKFMEQELLIKAYRELQEGVSKIGFFTKDGDKKLLKQGIEGCKIAYPKIKELIPIVNYTRMIQKPTSSPEANLLLNMAYALSKGIIQEEDFVETLQQAEESFNELKLKIESLSRQETDSVLVKEELQRSLEGLDLYGNAISDYYRFLENREGLFLDQAEWELKEAVEILAKSNKTFQEIGEREGKTPCIRCGRYNQPDRKTCEQCGAILPKAAASGTASTFDVQVGETAISMDMDTPIPENLEILFTAVNQVADDQISIDEFAATVDEFQNLMRINKAAGFAPLPQVNLSKLPPEEKKVAEDLISDLKEAKSLFEEGFRDFEEGIDYFNEYMEVGDKNLLVKGVQVIWEGNKKFHKVDQKTEGMEKLRK